MSDWNAGYITDISYTFGYYSELNPLRARLAVLAAGFDAPETLTACELGFGQGVSVNIHASGSTAQWWGNDFNPAQTLFAQQLSTASGNGAQLSDESFAEFCTRPDLPNFDFIGLHGIWTWISDENRAVIVDFLRRKLKVGGVLYISYNALPGWAANAPLRHLLSQHGSIMSAPGQGFVPRVNAALEFANKLFETKPMYGRAVPSASARVKKLGEQNRNYLAHEYLNRDWKPMYFADMAQWLEQAKLNFACSAHLLDMVAAVNLTQEQQKLLTEIPDPMFRESVRDYMTNVQFRRDYWIKGARPLSVPEQGEALRKLRVMLVTPRANVVLKVSGPRGEVNLNEDAHAPLLDALADHRPRTIGELEKIVREKGMKFQQLLASLLLMVGKNDVVPVQDEAVVTKIKPQAAKLNAKLLERIRSSGDINFLVSPLLGGGIPVPYAQQLMILGHRQGHTTRDELAKKVWQVLEALGRKVNRAGQPLQTPEENIAELQNIAEEFLNKRLPIYKALQII